MLQMIMSQMNWCIAHCFAFKQQANKRFSGDSDAFCYHKEKCNNVTMSFGGILLT